MWGIFISMSEVLTTIYSVDLINGVYDKYVKFNKNRKILNLLEIYLLSVAATNWNCYFS